MARPRFLSTVLAVSAASVFVMAATIGTSTEAKFGPLPAAPAEPSDNPSTPSKVALGRLLFWDPILSASGDVACATCHHPSFGYADGLDVSIGANGIGLGASRRFTPDAPVRFVKRNSPTVLNAAFNGLGGAATYAASASPMFWDTRVSSLEAQALEPIKALEEMRGDHGAADHAVDEAVARVAAVPEYRHLFDAAFGSKAPIDARNLSRAIAAFERTLVTGNAPFDRYMRGDTSAMTDPQVRGMSDFQTMGCANCHGGPMFSDYTLHVLGVPENRKLAEPDSGAGGRYAFRTPSLRNLAYTAPYMHNGTMTSLAAVVNFYNQVGGPGGGRGGRGGPGRGPSTALRAGGRGGRGGGINANVSRQNLDPLLRQVNVRSGSRQNVVAFLEALNDPGFDRTVPATVPTELTPGGKIAN